ncbi:hypothetical protein HanXRQr2_Chr13g0586881 [Helianthus annuus]|uniref:Uncharacterized protein n=1 Tax=Helianthus annuus TaxID=4232 RepID=A0A251SV22_HELAN|nr:hypothetical protein HanXRQr2_Chr13g0586881 [Helianthus annuus]KAJ0497615.1 hypothetical protein HanHA89_Chr13g0513261 [Helianthus annuus]KAJ0663620.1 hypothetical protein HanLR1_Chr13g0483141 [Helianthus annuus]KAJ0671119.1 hypothetical protein HanOQP8_Chr13g0482081 [Helianthus annuus]KAJ0849100.1 hypothetical protein HanPSC8_Chr13g0565051 [Helianthus annuus]
MKSCARTSFVLSNPLMEFWLSGVQEVPVGSASGVGFVSTANNEQQWGGVPVSRT